MNRYAVWTTQGTVRVWDTFNTEPVSSDYGMSVAGIDAAEDHARRLNERPAPPEVAYIGEAADEKPWLNREPVGGYGNLKF